MSSGCGGRRYMDKILHIKNYRYVCSLMSWVSTCVHSTILHLPVAILRNGHPGARSTVFPTPTCCYGRTHRTRVGEAGVSCNVIPFPSAAPAGTVGKQLPLPSFDHPTRMKARWGHYTSACSGTTLFLRGNHKHQSNREILRPLVLVHILPLTPPRQLLTSF